MHEFAWYVVFIGRPNAGKSSLIHRLTAAKPVIGKKPGSTRKIIEYPLSKKFRIVDIPGWGKIHGRPSMYEERIKDEILVFLEENKFRIPACVHVIDAKSLIDVSERLAKKGIIPIDQELYQFLCDLHFIPIVALNKIDKIDKSGLARTVAYFKELIDISTLSLEHDASIITVSARKGDNLPALRDLIRKRLRAASVEEFERYIKLS